MTSRDRAEEAAIALHRALIERWNAHDADGYAALFTQNANMVGFDGSVVDGADAIREHLAGIFADHETATYVTKVLEVRQLASEVVLLRAVAGMVPPGADDINPDANAVQSLVAVGEDGEWRAALWRNTPAAFHGRPQDAEALTTELRDVLRGSSESVRLLPSLTSAQRALPSRNIEIDLSMRRRRVSAVPQRDSGTTRTPALTPALIHHS
jgi:uncharacterized protein (TIGR02246 family)